VKRKAEWLAELNGRAIIGVQLTDDELRLATGLGVIVVTTESSYDIKVTFLRKEESPLPPRDVEAFIRGKTVDRVETPAANAIRVVYTNGEILMIYSDPDGLRYTATRLVSEEIQ